MNLIFFILINNRLARNLGSYQILYVFNNLLMFVGYTQFILKKSILGCIMLKLNKDTTLHLINFLSSVEHYLSKAEADRRVKQGFVSKWVDVSIQSMSESEFDAAIFTVPINALPDIKDLVEKVLSAAEVPRTELGRYTDSTLTIYNLLVELS